MNYKNIILPDIQPEAENFIKNIIDELEESGQLSLKDTGCFYILAESFDTYLQALELQKEHGLLIEGSSGQMVQNPASKIAKEQKTTVLRTMLEMGLSLRSRKTLKVLDNDGGEESPLQQFLKLQQK